MDFNIFQLRAFIATVETGSFSAAARKLGKVQSAISTAVMNLEIDLGVSLFDRTGRYPILTAQGESLRRDVNKILNDIGELQTKAETFSRNPESSLTIALDEALPWSMLTDFLEHFTQVYPHIDLELTEAAFDDCEPMIDSGKADIGCFIAPAPRLKPNMRIIAVTHPLAVVSPKHPLAQLDAIEEKDLSPHRQLIYTGKNGTHDTTDRMLSDQVWWVQSCSVTREIIRKGLAWGYLPEHMAKKDIKNGLLKELQLPANNGAMTLPFILAWRNTPALGPGGQYFVKYFGTHLGKPSPVH
ncbi:MAG: LysR family transcriptional regulator [Desulfobacterales bacterium]|nr:LysR family transcriptional regulator [Desulfobacterales bacterium]